MPGKQKATTNCKNVPIPILNASVQGFYIPSQQKAGKLTQCNLCEPSVEAAGLVYIE
jgi:hypothetical protein